MKEVSPHNSDNPDKGRTKDAKYAKYADETTVVEIVETVGIRSHTDIVEASAEASGEASIAPAQPPARDRHPVLVYLASLSEGSRRTMRASLEIISGFISSGRAGAETLPWHELRYQHTAAIRSELAGKYKPATANKMLSAMKGVIKECWRLGYITAEERERATDLSPIKGSTLPKGRSLSPGERKALFDACAEDEKPVRGARDAALLAILYVCGLRRSEASGLDLSDYDPREGSLRIRAAKGNKERMTYATGGAAEAIEGWLFHRRHEPGPLLWPVQKNGELIERRIHPQTVYDILARRAKEVSSGDFSPHDFRRTFVGDIIDAKGDLSTAQKLAGHSSPETTSRYDRRGERAMKEASSELHVPYRAPRTPSRPGKRTSSTDQDTDEEG
jgi:integrase